MLTRGRADQRFHALESMSTSEPAHYRLCLLESKRISEGAQEKPGLLEKTGTGFRRCAAQLREGEGQAQLRWRSLYAAF